MKKTAILLIALCTISTAEAQWLDALKKVATEVIDSATDGKLTQIAIVGEWSYKAPAVKLSSDNVVSNIGGSAISATINSKMEDIFEKVGIKEGFCSITFADDDKFTIPIVGKQISGSYTYNNSDHSIVLSIGNSGKINIKGYAYISGSNLQLLFPANKFADLLIAIGSTVNSLNTITELLKQYDDIYLGFEFAK